ncbi:pyridoxamine 5'-phosphate oxidase-like protein (plasmid) [Rhizobium etli]|uniref:Pyridoxamine 5'-phosphate oxidase-like protein n=2 Tax=Rhizobium etli TaxID=29449 RepID=A0AAN1BK93_RHIET|nr:pyridoxamine 5'-phosphate oxidase-like protein [Rhizobium etli bv. mimosae str. Mim1]ARQ12815.1 pyridoxamine 5'-phosphate oxidase-like protein [Rhizobium etli]
MIFQAVQPVRRLYSASRKPAFLNECARHAENPKSLLRRPRAQWGMVMRLDDRLLDFFNRPLMCIIAVADEAGRPSAGRGVGFHLLEDRETVDVIFSAWQWPRLEPCIRATKRIAATFVSPADYVGFQLKGAAAMRETEEPDLDRADRFMTLATDALESLGVPRRLIGPWLTARDARVARLAISEIYVQTPGPLAGMLAGERSGAGSR